MYSPFNNQTQIVGYALLFTLFISSCRMSQKSEVEKVLLEKYNEPFIVFHDEYSRETQTCQFQVAPQRNQKLVFVGEHNPDFSVYYDQYVERTYCTLYQEKLKRHIETYTSPAYVFAALTLDSRLSEYKKLQIDTLNVDTAMLRSGYIHCSIICYLFKTLTPNTKAELLTGIYEAVHPFTQHRNAVVSVSVLFWKPEFLKNHNLSVFEFDRLQTSSPASENIAEKKEYVTNTLEFYFNTKKPFVDFNIDSLYFYATTKLELVNLNLLADSTLYGE